MTARIIDKYAKEFKYLEKEFSFITQSYYTQTDLHQQINHLLSHIHLQLQSISHDHQIAQKRRKTLISDPLYSLQQDFVHLIPLKQIKKPVDPNTVQEHLIQHPIVNQLSTQSPFSSLSHLKPYLTPYPNRSLTIQIQINQLESICNNFPTLAQGFPPHFTFHIHHLHHHLKTDLHFNSKHGLFETGTFLPDQNTYIHSILKNQTTLPKLDKKSCKSFELKYIFRQSNLQMYEGMFSKEQNQNIIFSITNSSDPSHIIIAMAKINLKDILSRSQNNKQKLIETSFPKLLFFRKLISFNQICPIEELPLLCKVKLDLTIKEQIVSPLIEDLNDLFYNQLQYKNDQKMRSTLKKQVSRSPRKIIDKTPPKRNILDPSVGKSPHHKKSYIKEIFHSKYPTSANTIRSLSPLLETKKEKKKYQKLTCLDETETCFRLRNHSVISDNFGGQRFKGTYLSSIESEIKRQNIDVHENENVHLKIQMLTPLVQIHENGISESDNLSVSGSEQYLNDYSSFLPQFSIRIRALISLKDKDRSGRITFELPFLKKLNKLLHNSGQDKKCIAFAYEITVEPNTLFKIEQYSQINQEQQRRERGIKSYSRPSLALEDNKFLQNKIVRLDSNLYAFSQSFLNARFKRYSYCHRLRNIQLHQIDGSYLSVFNFILRKKKQFTGEPLFNVYPFGSVFKVVKSMSGVYSICFKLDPSQYLPYSIASQAVESKQSQNDTSFKMKKHNQSTNSDQIIIQMAISCFLKTSEQKDTLKSKTEMLQSTKEIKETKKQKQKTLKAVNQSQSVPVKSQKQKTIELTQVQFFKAKLNLNTSNRPNRSFRQIEVKESDEFCDLDMKFLSKQKSVYTILSSKPESLSVVNGTNYKYTDNNDRLILQIMNQVKPYQHLDVVLILEDWQKCITSTIELKLVNRQKKTELNQANQPQLSTSIKKIKFSTQINHPQNNQ